MTDLPITITPLPKGIDLPELEYDRLYDGDDGRTAAYILSEYVQLKEAAKAIEARIKAIQNDVINVITDEKGAKIADFLGAEFRLQTRKTWIYSDDLQAVEDRLKAQKAIEKREGTAKLSKSAVSVVCTLPKR